MGINTDRIIALHLRARLRAGGRRRGALRAGQPARRSADGLIIGPQGVRGGGAGRHRQHPRRAGRRFHPRADGDVRHRLWRLRRPRLHLARRGRVRDPDPDPALAAGRASWAVPCGRRSEMSLLKRFGGTVLLIAGPAVARTGGRPPCTRPPAARTCRRQWFYRQFGTFYPVRPADRELDHPGGQPEPDQRDRRPVLPGPRRLHGHRRVHVGADDRLPRPAPVRDRRRLAPGAAPPAWGAAVRGSLVVGGLAPRSPASWSAFPRCACAATTWRSSPSASARSSGSSSQHITAGGRQRWASTASRSYQLLLGLPGGVRDRRCGRATSRSSGHGRALLAIREDEIAAEAMGVTLTRYKVLAFVIGAFFAGAGGRASGPRPGRHHAGAAGFIPVHRDRRDGRARRLREHHGQRPGCRPA